MEMEAIVRRRSGHGAFKDLPCVFEESDSGSSSLHDKYTAMPPMEYPKPKMGSINDLRRHSEEFMAKVPAERTRSAAHSAKGSDYDVTALDTILESSREPSVAAPVLCLQPEVEELSSKKLRQASVQNELLAPTPTKGRPWPLLRYLGQRWYMVPPDEKENEASSPSTGKVGDGKSGRKSQEVPQVSSTTRPATSISLKGFGHSLHEDKQHPRTTGKNLTHTLDEDLRTPTRDQSRFREHPLEEDQVNPSAVASAARPHHLEIDPSQVTRPNLAHKHDLDDEKGA